MLEVKNLKKNFGDFPAVKGVSFSVKEGEVLEIGRASCRERV